MSGRRVGFTLVELLVVIGIIVVLAAILFPVFSGVMRKTRQAKCRTHLTQLVVALKLYREDYNYYPQLPVYDASISRYTGGVSALFPEYISDYGTMLCPDDAAVRNHEKEARDRNYSSYNGRIVGEFRTTGMPTHPAGPGEEGGTTPSGPDPVYWQFMPLAANGFDPGNEADATDPTKPRMRLYNWGGFNDSGYDTGIYDEGTGQWVFHPNPAWGDELPDFMVKQNLTWRQYPRLSNNKAPDSTIAMHCTWHRGKNPVVAATFDIVAYVSGNVTMKNVGNMQGLDPTLHASEWKMQR